MANLLKNLILCRPLLSNSFVQRSSASGLMNSCVVHPHTYKMRLYSSSVDSHASNSKYFTTTSKDESLFRAIDVLVKGHEKSVLDSFMTFMIVTAKHLEIDIAGQLTPKFIADRSTFLKSVHIYKKHRVQYEMRTHRLVLQLKYLTSSTANVYLEYVQRNIPAGVAMHVHKWRLERLPEHIQERMKDNLSLMSDEDWIQQSHFIKNMKNERSTKAVDYQEYHTTKRFLLGTVM